MKITFYIILFLVCFGAADLIIKSAGMDSGPITAYDPDQVSQAFNASNLVASYDPQVNVFFDIGAGLHFLWNLNEPLIGSFAATLRAYGAPEVLVDVVRVIYRFSFLGLIIQFMTGRDFMP